jgi:hypothetical protein
MSKPSIYTFTRTLQVEGLARQTISVYANSRDEAKEVLDLHLQTIEQRSGRPMVEYLPAPSFDETATELDHRPMLVSSFITHY